MAVQFKRKGFHWENLAGITKMALVTMSLNVYLWFDFVVNVIRNNQNRTDGQCGWLNELLDYSSDLMICIFMIPFFFAKKAFKK